MSEQQLQASLSSVPLGLKNAIPIAFDLKTERHFEVLHGATEHSLGVHRVSNPNSSSVQVNCHPPSVDTFIDPVMWKRMKGTISMDVVTQRGVSGDAMRLASLGHGATPAAFAETANIILRDHPLDKIISNEEVKINNVAFNEPDLADYHEAFYRFSNKTDDKINEYTLTPKQLDEFPTYGAAGNTAKDPFANYGNTEIGEPRRSFPVEYSLFQGATAMAFDANLADATTYKFNIDFDVMEPVKISPFYFQPYCLAGVKSLTYSASFSNIERAICASSKMDIANIKIKNIQLKVDDFEIHTNYYSPKLLQNVPSSIIYPHQEVEYQAVEITSTDGTARFNNVNLNSVPRSIVIWVSEQKNDLLGLTGDAYNERLQKTATAKARITKITIGFANRDGILAEFDEQDLFILSKKRGLNLSYPQTTKYVGGYCKFNFGEDIPLSEGLAPGVQSLPMLRFTVTYKNLVGDATVRKYQLNSAIIYEGTCTIIKNSSALKTKSVLTSNDVIDSLQKGLEIVHPAPYSNNKFGGNGGSLLSVLSAAIPIAKAIRSGIQVGAPIAKNVADMAEKIGLGNGGKISGKISGGRVGTHSRQGGRVISRNQLNDEMY
jgi:hypothetical protein